MRPALLFLSIFLLEVCQAQELDSNFYFSIKSSNDQFNSQTKKFGRIYSGGEWSYYTIDLSGDELREIYLAMDEAGFENMPSVFKPKGDTIIETTPSFKYMLESNFGGKKKVIVYDTRLSNKAMEKEGKPYLELYSRIWSILHSNPQVEKLKPSNVYWE